MGGCSNCHRYENNACGLEARFSALESNLMEQVKMSTETATIVRELKLTLLGNGKAGRCADHESQLVVLRDWKTAENAARQTQARYMHVFLAVAGAINIPALLGAFKTVKHLLEK